METGTLHGDNSQYSGNLQMETFWRSTHGENTLCSLHLQNSCQFLQLNQLHYHFFFHWTVIKSLASWFVLNPSIIIEFDYETNYGIEERGIFRPQ